MPDPQPQGSTAPSAAAAPAAAAAAAAAAATQASTGGAAPAATQGSSAAAPASSASSTAAAPAAGGTADPAEPPKGAWPDDWRERVSKTDQKALARLQRYASPEAALEALSALQLKISSGELRAVPKKDATPEELAAYRAAAGIPEKPEGYELTLRDGFAVPKEDRPVVDGFLATAHGANLNSAQASAVVDWYYAEQERVSEAIAQRDKADAVKARDELSAEWGADYRANVNSIYSLLDLAPAGVKEKLIGHRLEDGKGLASDPNVLRWFAALAREVNPAGTVAPGAGATQLNTIEDEITQIETLMRTDRKAYNRDANKQQRLRDLYAARDKAKARAA